MEQKKILVVDDEHTILRLSQILLQRRGHSVQAVLSSKEARSVLGASGPVDIIVLDLMMPEENGFDFLTWKSQQPEALAKIPVVVSTAKNLSEDERKFLKEKVVNVISKGVDFSEKLVSVVEAALAS